jgi:3'-5' exoribonuclease
VGDAVTLPEDSAEGATATQPSPPPPAPAPADDMEKVRKVYVRDLREKEKVTTVFRVAQKQRNTSRAGKSFLALSLVDKTGDVDARIFEAADELEKRFETGDYVLISGEVISFHGKPQVVLAQVERLDPEPIDPREFTPPEKPEKADKVERTQAGGPAAASPAPGKGERSAEEGRRAVAQLREQVERVHDGHVRQLLLAFLDDPTIAEGLPVAPAAKGIHHAYRGGLADHLLSNVKLAHRIAEHYPMADRDLLVAGALLHDIYKVKELSYEHDFSYTDEGRLVGHLVMTAQAIREKASKIPDFPPLLEHHLTHLVIAHHGQLEYGSPKVPMTLEALLVHLIDLMDSRVQSWLDLMGRDSSNSDRWTDHSKLYDRQIWKGPAPTARGKSPVEGRRRGGGGGGGGNRPRDEKRRRDRPERTEAKAPGGGGGGGAPRPPKVERKPEVEPKRDPTLPSDLTFKPFSLLVPETPPKES